MSKDRRDVHQVAALAVLLYREGASSRLGAAAIDAGVRMKAGDVGTERVARVATDARGEHSLGQGIGPAVFG